MQRYGRKWRGVAWRYHSRAESSWDTIRESDVAIAEKFAFCGRDPGPTTAENIQRSITATEVCDINYCLGGIVIRNDEQRSGLMCDLSAGTCRLRMLSLGSQKMPYIGFSGIMLSPLSLSEL